VALPKRDQIANELRDRIADGTYPPGVKLTEAELMIRHSAARGTVREALKLLEEAGLVYRRVGTAGGTFVRRQLTVDVYAWRDDEPMHRNSEAALFYRTIVEQGHTSWQDFSAREDVMPAEFAALLRVPVSSPAVTRRCIRYVDGNPHSIQVSWYPDWLCDQVPELRSPVVIAQGTTRLLAERGYLQKAAMATMVAHRLSEADAAILRIPPGPPVLSSVLVGYTDDGPLRISAATNAPGTRLVSVYGDASVVERYS
jgi:GntR family transcriptional regulator